MIEHYAGELLAASHPKTEFCDLCWKNPQRRAYEACLDRGHERGNTTLTSNPPQYVCLWCGTRFQTEPSRQVEMP
jgi:hypothetical protein